MLNCDNILIANKPNRVFIPIIDNDATIIAKNGDYVYKESVLGYTKGDDKQYIYSTVSGHVGEAFTINTYQGNIVPTKCIVIKNDLKEIVENLKGTNKKIDDISKDIFLTKIKRNCLIDNNNNYLYNNYLNKIDTLVINLSDTTDIISNFYLEKFTNEILEAIDAIIEINKIKKCYLIVNKANKQLIKLLEQSIGTYLKINLAKTRKNLSQEYIIKKFKIKDNYYFESIKNAYFIYDILKNNNPLLEKYIFVYENEEIKFIKVKIGTFLCDLMSTLNINHSNFKINYFESTPVTNNQLVITQAFDGIIIEEEN